MRDRVEVLGQISVDHVGVAPADQPVHFLDRVHRPARGPVAIGIVLEVRLEDRLQHELGGGLNHPIPDRRNAERTLAATRLRDHHPPHRLGPVRLRDQFLAQARQPCFQRPTPRSARRSSRPRPARPHWRGPAHRRGAGCPRGKSCRRADRSGRQAPPSPCDTAFSEGSGSYQVLPGSSPITFTSPSSKAHQKSGPFPPPALPGFNGPMTLSDSRRDRRLSATLRPLPSPATGLPRLPESPFRRAVPTTPADRDGCACRLLPRSRGLPRNGRRVGIRIVTFEACSGFTRVTARRIAQPPKAAFVTRLRPGRLPSRAARQLPDQSTTLWVEPSSTGDTRLRGALQNACFSTSNFTVPSIDQPRTLNY